MTKPPLSKIARPSSAGLSKTLGTVASSKTKPIVRYPTAGNALRAHLNVVRGGGGMSPEQAQRRQDKQEKKTGRVLASRLLEHLVEQAPAKRLVLKRRAPSAETLAPKAAAPSKSPIVGLRPDSMTSAKLLGETLRVRRLILRLTQAQAAKRAGVGRRFIVDLERGKPTLEIAKVLAVVQALGLTLTAQAADVD